MSSTTYVVFAEEGESTPRLLGVAHTIKGAKGIGDEHFDEVLGSTDYLTDDNLSASTRGTPVPEDEAGWVTQDDGSLTRAFTTGYRVRAFKVRVRD
jgi:hypothetical protein